MRENKPKWYEVAWILFFICPGIYIKQGLPDLIYTNLQNSWSFLNYQL